MQTGSMHFWDGLSHAVYHALTLAITREQREYTTPTTAA